jgi:hypothetical protein
MMPAASAWCWSVRQTAHSCPTLLCAEEQDLAALVFAAQLGNLHGVGLNGGQPRAGAEAPGGVDDARGLPVARRVALVHVLGCKLLVDVAHGLVAVHHQPETIRHGGHPVITNHVAARDQRRDLDVGALRGDQERANGSIRGRRGHRRGEHRHREPRRTNLQHRSANATAHGLLLLIRADARRIRDPCHGGPAESG